MTVHLLIGLGLLAQTAVVAPTGRSDTPPVRVWLPDTVRPVGDPLQVYVALRETGHLVVLHLDASGRFRVLFPRNPSDPDMVPGGETFAIAGTEDGVTFRVPVPGMGAVLAVRSRAPFQFDGLTAGGRWDYEHALLFLPTAGNPFAALLDIADRIADGEAYTYDLAEYRTPGAVAARPVARDSVCFSCLAARRSGRAAGAAGAGAITNSAIAIDHSYAAAPGGTVVDCSSSTLVDSFCGVQDNSVSTTVEETTIDQSTTVVYPVVTPLFFPRRRFRRPPPAPAPPPPAIALNLRRVPGRIVPPAPRRPPRIVVQQPRAASHPDSYTPPDAASDETAPVTAPAPRIVVRRAQSYSAPQSAAPAAGWTTTGGGRQLGTASVPQASAAPAAGAAGAGGQAARPVIVPSRAVARAYANPRH